MIRTIAAAIIIVSAFAAVTTPTAQASTNAINDNLASLSPKQQAEKLGKVIRSHRARLMRSRAQAPCSAALRPYG
jgi:hypothetical protein